MYKLYDESVQTELRKQNTRREKGIIICKQRRQAGREDKLNVISSKDQ